MSPKEVVDQQIEDHFIMVFSKSYCPYCNQTKKLLKELGLSGDKEPYYVELDQVEDGGEQQSYLASKTGQRTVPSVFINKKHIGGNSDLQALAKSGDLKKLVA